MGRIPSIVKTKNSNRLPIIMLAALMIMSGLFLLVEQVEGSVSAGNMSLLVSSGQRAHENSTAIQVIGFGATSDTGSDTLSTVRITITKRSSLFTISDLASISTNGSISGIAIYADNGNDDDDIDPADDVVSISSFTLTTGTNTWTYTFTVSSENVPTSFTGLYYWIVAVRTSTTCSVIDQFDVSIPSSGITFSDSTTMPNSLVRTNIMTIYLTDTDYIQNSDPIYIGEHGTDIDEIEVQGLSIFSGRAGIDIIDSLEVQLDSISSFDLWTDLLSIDNTTGSGIKLYLDDGITTPDVLDPATDTRLVAESIMVKNGSGRWNVMFDLPDSGPGAYTVPISAQGNHDLFIVIATSSSVSNGDSFFTSIPAWGMTYKGADGISRSVLPSSNRSRTIKADTMAPDISNASLRIYTNPISGYVYEADTDLTGRDEIFYNSVSTEGLGIRIYVNIRGYEEDNIDSFVGEAAFDYLTPNIDNIFYDGTEISYRITQDRPDNPMTFKLVDAVGHSTSFDVYFTEDNTPPRVENLSLHDISKYIETQLDNRKVYFRPNMVSPQDFSFTGTAFEPEGEAGLNYVFYTNEPSLHSSPSIDYTAAEFNGTYSISSLSTDFSSNLTVEVYDRVQNKWVTEINYTMILDNPEVEMIVPSESGINISGIYRIIARVRSTPSIWKMEFGVDDDTDLLRMTLGGTQGDWEIYYIDWDTVDYAEGEHVLKVKATDMTNGIAYNSTVRANVNNYPLWGYYQNPIYGDAIRDAISVNVRVSQYIKNANLYVDSTLVDSFSGYPKDGTIRFLLDTEWFQDGTHQMKTVLKGFAGREIELIISVEIDNTDPVIERVWVDYPGTQEALKPGDRVRLAARIYDNGSGVVDPFVVANPIGGSTFQYLYDNGLVDDGSANDLNYKTNQFTASGLWAYHTLRYVVTDRAGNTVERKINVAIDDKDPLVEELWIDYPGSQEAAKSGDEIQVMAELSDSTIPLYVTLILDNSGSMRDSGRLDYLLTAAKSFINSTREIDYVSIFRFYWVGEDEHPGTPPGWDKRIMNFTRMDDTGRQLAISIIDNVKTEFETYGGTGTPIWDTIGNATSYTMNNAQSNPFVIAFTDGADNYAREFPMNNVSFEEGSQYFCPWHSWNQNRFVDYHWGKYPDAYNETGYYWVRSKINQTRSGLLNIPIPVYTIGLGLEHHDPPNEPRRTNAPYGFEFDNTSAYWTGESGTPEYNLWRISETSAGGEYYYAPSPTFLESVYRKISSSIYSTDDPANVMRATALLPLDFVLDVELYDDGLHGDGIAGDDIWASEKYTVPDLPTENRVVILDVWDWANNTVTWDVDFISDNSPPSISSIEIIYPEGRSSVGDGEPFSIEVNLTDKGGGVWKITGDAGDMGYFPVITFNNTGKGNDRNMSDTIWTSVNASGQTGNMASTYKFVDLVVTDLAGNQVKARTQVLLVNDLFAPTLTMITPKDSGYLGGTDPISCIVRDDGEIRRVTYRIMDDNGTIIQEGFISRSIEDLYSSPVDVTLIEEGTYKMEVIAEDTAGRLGSSGVLDIGIDSTIPQFTLHSPKNGSYVGGTVSFLYTFNDLFPDFVGYSVDGGPIQDSGKGLDTTFYTEGYHQVGVRGYDGRGKSQGTILDLYFDNSVPNVDLSLPSNGVMVNGTQKVIARVMDGGGIQFVETRIYEWGNRTSPTAPDVNEVPVVSLRMDGPQLAVVTAGFYEGILQTWGLPDGRYLLDVAAVDRSGTTGHALQYLPIDNNAPNLNVLYPVDGGAVSGIFTPDAQADDPFLSKAYFNFNGAEYPFDAEIDMNGVPDGRYLMKFVAIDSALRTTTEELIVYVDKTPPAVSIESPGNGYAAGDELLVLARIDEVAGVRYAFLNMDGDNVLLGTPVGDGGLYSFTLNMTPFDRSPHEIKIIVENAAGMITESETRTIYKGYLDTDGDGVTDPYDDDPDDPTITGDIDGDGFGSFTDLDDDGDGILDEFEPDGESLFLSGETKGIPFRLDPTEWSDVDEDGIGDNSDPDADGDSIINDLDAFPYDPLEWLDTDHDGIGDNNDPDRDGDGVDNDDDDLPLDPTEWTDTDGDGVGNNKDEDDDNDGLPDSRDDFPTNRFRKYRYLPQVTIVVIGLIAIIAVFSAVVFREEIAVELQTSWSEGRLKNARSRIRSAFKEKEEKWEEDDRKPGRRRAPPVRKRK